MLGLLWLIPALPFAGFVILALAGSRLSRRGAALVGVGSVGLSALLAWVLGGGFLLSPPAGQTFTQTLWSWIDVAGFRPEITFRLDALSLIMILVVTSVGFLIHLYSAEFYRQLWRILKAKGRLFHYIGDPNSKSGRNVTRGAVKRLKEAGFRRVSARPHAFGVLAFP